MPAITSSTAARKHKMEAFISILPQQVYKGHNHTQLRARRASRDFKTPAGNTLPVLSDVRSGSNATLGHASRTSDPPRTTDIAKSAGLARAFFTFCSIGRCSHVFGLSMRFTGPLATMPSADQVPIKLSHLTMRWHEWFFLIAGSTGSALRCCLGTGPIQAEKLRP